MKTWKSRTNKQNNRGIKERVTLIYNCKILPASSIFTKIEHSKNQFIRETFENSGRNIKCPCIKLNPYSPQCQPDDKPSCLLSWKSCSVINISTIIACNWC